MKISLCNEVIAAGLPFERQCELVAGFGYDGLELAPTTLDPQPHRLPAARRAEMRRAAKEAGIEITGLHYLLRAPEGLSITSADAAQRARSVGVMRDLCVLAADLGGKVLVHGSPDQRRLAPGHEAEGRKHAADCFAAVADAAAAAGVVYCIEPLSPDQTGCINTVAEAVEIVNAIGNPAIRTMIDCSSAALAERERVADLIRRWVPTGLIAHVHFNDPNRQGPGDGELDFAPILQALRDVNYAGNSAIEPFIYKPDGPACAARGIKHIRELMEASA